LEEEEEESVWFVEVARMRRSLQGVKIRMGRERHEFDLDWYTRRRRRRRRKVNVTPHDCQRPE